MKRVVLIVALVFGLAPSPTSAQTFADSVSAAVFMLHRIDSARVALPYATRVLCVPNGGGRIWPDSVRGGESFDTEPMTGRLYAAVADSLSQRFDLPTVPTCQRNGPGYRTDAEGRQAVLVGLATPVFLAADSAVAHVDFSVVGWESFAWTCRIHRTGRGWEITSPCLESSVQR
jgi:hypothetical protein